MTNRIPMTPGGQRQLTKRLKQLKSVDRPRNVAAIEEARGHGDLTENAEYDYAKEQQHQLNKQIKELEHKLSLAWVIDPKAVNSDKVVFGATVTVSDAESSESSTYSIVGSDEADIASGKISVESPMARAMIGREEGDVVKVKTPKGLREFEIVSIRYE